MEYNNYDNSPNNQPDGDEQPIPRHEPADYYREDQISSPRQNNQNYSADNYNHGENPQSYSADNYNQGENPQNYSAGNYNQGGNPQGYSADSYNHGGNPQGYSADSYNHGVPQQQVLFQQVHPPIAPLVYNEAYYPRVNYSALIRKEGNIIGFMQLMMFIVQFVLFGIVYNVIASSSPIFDSRTLEGTVFNALSYSLFFIIPIVLGIVLLRIPLRVAVPMRRPETSTLFGAIGVSMGAVIVGNIVTEMLYRTMVNTTGYAPFYAPSDLPRGTAANIVYFISLAVLPALFEEIMFRGVIMQSLRKYGDGFALIVSSILFGLAHGNLVQAPYATIFGLVTGYFVLYSGSLIPGMAIHFVNNATVAIIQWITVDTSEQTDTFIYTSLFILRIIIGIVSIIMLRSRRGSLFYVPPEKETGMSTGKKSAVFFGTSAVMILFFIACVYLFITNLVPADTLPADYMEALIR